MLVKMIGPKDAILVERELASLLGPLGEIPAGAVLKMATTVDGKVVVLVALPDEDAVMDAEDAAIARRDRREPPVRDTDDDDDDDGVSLRSPICPVCEGEMVLRDGTRGTFWGCADYPGCDGTRCAIDTQTVAVEECPYCGGILVRRENKRTGAPFWGCSGFPHCKGMLPWARSAVRCVPVVPDPGMGGRLAKVDYTPDDEGNIPF